MSAVSSLVFDTKRAGSCRLETEVGLLTAHGDRRSSANAKATFGSCLTRLTRSTSDENGLLCELHHTVLVRNSV